MCVGVRDGVEAHLCVHLEGEHDLGCAVPPRRDVLGHEPCLLAARVGRARAACETEVADLEVAVGVQEEIRRLEVAVDDVCAVHRLERAQSLIHEVLCVHDPIGGRSTRRDRSIANDWRIRDRQVSACEGGEKEDQ